MKSALFALIFIIFLNGCTLFVGEDAFGESWAGQPLTKLIAQWGEPAHKTTNESSETEVIYELFNGDCTYYFYANDKGIISSYKYKSSGWSACKPIG